MFVLNGLSHHAQHAFFQRHEKQEPVFQSLISQGLYNKTDILLDFHFWWHSPSIKFRFFQPLWAENWLNFTHYKILLQHINSLDSKKSSYIYGMSATFLKTLGLSVSETLPTLHNKSFFIRNFPGPYKTCYGHTCT